MLPIDTGNGVTMFIPMDTSFYGDGSFPSMGAWMDILWIVIGMILSLLVLYQITTIGEKKLPSIKFAIKEWWESFNGSIVMISCFTVMLMVMLFFGAILGPLTCIFNILFLLLYIFID